MEALIKMPHGAEALVPSPQRTERQKEKLAFNSYEDACFDLISLNWVLSAVGNRAAARLD